MHRWRQDGEVEGAEPYVDAPGFCGAVKLAEITEHGHVLTDLVARPVGLSCIRSGQANQTFEVLKKKFFCDGGRAKVGVGYDNVGLVILNRFDVALGPSGDERSTCKATCGGTHCQWG